MKTVEPFDHTTINRITAIITLAVSDNRMESVFPTETLDALGLDSLDRWDMVVKIEEEFKIDIEQEAIAAWVNVQDVIDTVSNLSAPPIDPRIAEIDMLLRQMDDYKIARPMTSGALVPVEMRDAIIKQLRDKINVHTDGLIKVGKFPIQSYKDMDPAEYKAGMGDYSEAELTRAALKIGSSKTYGQIDTPVINRITRDDVQGLRDVVTYSPADKENGCISDIDYYQKIATKSAIYPGQGTPLGLAYVALKLNGEAGEFAEHVGKAMRDDALFDAPEVIGGVATFCGGTLTPERRAAIIKEIGDCLWYASAACNELGITLSEAALTNLEKLCDRTERDALRGSGDDR